MRAFIVAGGILLVLAGATYSVLKPEKVFGVSGSQLGSSLAANLGEAEGGACAAVKKNGKRALWWCYVEGERQSFDDTEAYVTARTAFVLEAQPGQPCWRARRARTGSRRGAKPVEGCVDFLDYIAPKRPSEALREIEPPPDAVSYWR